MKIVGCVFGTIIAIALIFSIVTGYITYPLSFLKNSIDNEYKIRENVSEVTKVLYSGKSFKTEWFNYYGIKYTSEAYYKGTLTYFDGLKEISEDFFLEPAENGEFFSFIDGFLDGKKANAICDIQFECLGDEESDLVFYGISTFNRDIPENEVFIESTGHKLGIDLHWGGALSYLEALGENVEAVFVDERIKVDSNASERYNGQASPSTLSMPTIQEDLFNSHITAHLIMISVCIWKTTGDIILFRVVTSLMTQVKLLIYV